MSNTTTYQARKLSLDANLDDCTSEYDHIDDCYKAARQKWVESPMRKNETLHYQKAFRIVKITRDGSTTINERIVTTVFYNQEGQEQ